MRISKVALLAGVNIQTVRFYERRGVIEKPVRRKSGYREYTEDTVSTIRTVKNIQKLGFTLEEIKQLVQLQRRCLYDKKIPEINSLIRSKICDIDEKLTQLKAIRESLQDLLICECVGVVPECPVLVALDNSSLDQPITLAVERK